MEEQPGTPQSMQSTESAESPRRQESHFNHSDDEADMTQPDDASHTNVTIAKSSATIADGTHESVSGDASANAPAEPKPKKKKAKGLPMRLTGPLPALPSSTPLPDLEDFNLRREQLKNPLFVAISKVLIVYGNAWQSATDLVDGIRHFNLANLGGRTPKGTVQGAISTGLALAAALGTFEPIEKQRMNSTTYYRMAAQALEPPSSDMESDATEAESSKVSSARKPTVKAKAPQRSAPPANQNKRTVSGWSSGSMSSGSSDDEDTDSKPSSSRNGNNTSGNDHKSLLSSKRARTGSPSSNSSRGRGPSKQDIIPNGLKKLPKGYVYDTDINQSALMNLSINPLQTGEFIQHLSTINAMENDFPDRRAEFKVDLEQEPSMFAVEQQVGYTYPRLRTSGRERLPKADCEDGFAVSDLKFRGGYLGRLFCITDGHGGRACSSFVIATIPGAMQVILGKYKPKDLSLLSVQSLVKSQIIEAVRLIDKEYLDYKKQQYLLYKAKKIPNDPGSDGTTLIVNIFIDKWIININLGDSRTMLSQRDQMGRWNVDFYSEDHTPSLERLAQTIYANGGEFVTHDDKVIRFDPNLKNDKKHRQSLKEARIRVKDAASNLYGIPYRTRNGQCASVNLGACIGDVLYKLDPVNPVLSCKPDITFIDISSIQRGYLLMASDGLWDYVQRGGKVQDQNAAVSQFVGDKLDRGWNYQRIVCTLSDREGMTGLYSDPIQEYDDFTAILVSIDAKQEEPKEEPQAKEQGVNGEEVKEEVRDPVPPPIQAIEATPSTLAAEAPTQAPPQASSQAPSASALAVTVPETEPKEVDANEPSSKTEEQPPEKAEELVDEVAKAGAVLIDGNSEQAMEVDVDVTDSPSAPEPLEDLDMS
ncbi:Protein phosphatase 1L [Podila epicladia]|nr:Protein phosphatase 1L [Podila epicladia]KAG0100454.1 Protein phosphatase 1L [Podila epicladia]